MRLAWRFLICWHERLGSTYSCREILRVWYAQYVFPQFVNNKVRFPVGQLLVENFVFVNFVMQYPNRVLCIGKTFPNFVLLSVGSDILN